MVKSKVYRLYTEDIGDVKRIARKAGLADFTVYTGNGWYEGDEEPSIILEVIAPAGIPAAATERVLRRIAETIIEENGQIEVLITVSDTEALHLQRGGEALPIESAEAKADMEQYAKETEPLATTPSISEVKTITRAPEGAARRVVPIQQVEIPNLWHVAQHLRDNVSTTFADAVLECWHLCHDLRLNLLSPELINAPFIPWATIRSYHGDIMIDYDGVISRELSRYYDDELKTITRFDAEEYRTHYNSIEGGSIDIDILDIGYWYKTPIGTLFKKPDSDFRFNAQDFSKQ